MKQLIFVLVLSLSTGLLISQNAPQQERRATVTLTEREWEMVLTIIDNSATQGEIRKPLIDKIRLQAASQLYPDTIPTKKTDTVKPKQNAKSKQ